MAKLPNVRGELDGMEVRLRDVPRSRLPDFVVVREGRRVRPYRFIDVDEDTFTHGGDEPGGEPE